MKINSSPDIKIFLIGNKSDLEESRTISKNQAERLKEDYDIDYFLETSAKTGKNAQEIFVKAAKLLYKNYNEYQSEKKRKPSNSNNNKINIKDDQSNKANNNNKKGCCEF